MKRLVLLVLLSPALASVALAQTAADPAVMFGALDSIDSAALSADGSRLVYTGPGPGTTTLAFVAELASGAVKPVAKADGDPLRLAWCAWSAADRLVCQSEGLTEIEGQLAPVSRLFAMDADGNNMKNLGERNTAQQLHARQFDGTVIDLLGGTDGTVLVTRTYVPELSTGSRLARSEEGLGVVRIDTRTLKVSRVEKPHPTALGYGSDGRGEVRLMTLDSVATTGQLSDHLSHYYRKSGEWDWQALGSDDIDRSGIEPLAVDPTINAAYVLKRRDGRDALYSIALDGSMKIELVVSNPDVDIANVVTIGRGGRVIGVTFITDRSQVEYFDASYKQLAASLARAIPKLPLIRFVGASADEHVLLILASSDVDPGRLYVFDRTNKRLNEIMLARPELEGVTLAQVQSVNYPAADGASIPAYLTLPPGVASAKNLPAIVMPHGGPAARDVWGFDWLAQYFANRGFVVLQPNFRGSTGYGDNWFVDNGFKSWRIAVGDVSDGGRWLVAQGMADPSKLAIFGWPYGGYAALQANVLDPDLFKAVVAVAPVTDLAMMKEEASRFKSRKIVVDYIGSGPHIGEGSPARHADQFKAPVLLFHGEDDLNVAVDESRKMDAALKDAGKSSELIVYPKLDHQLPDGKARADMLRRSDAFLRASLKLDASG